MTQAELLDQLIAANEEVARGLARVTPADKDEFRELAAALREMADAADKLAAEGGE